MLLEKICEELGVEIGEEWIGNDDKVYIISKTGKIFRYNDDGFFVSSGYSEWGKIFIGSLKPVWKPKTGDYFWTVDFIEEEKAYEYTWHDNETENRLLKRDLVFKTKEEAMKSANKMLKSLKED